MINHYSNIEYNSENVLYQYLNDINKVPLLTREEEDVIARKAVKGDEIARKKLIQANLRFVVSVAKKYQGQGIPLEDLINEGNIGLMSAIEKYDPDKGYHFISYAVWWIRQSILKAICEKSRMIRLPLNRANELVQIEKLKKEYEREYQSEPDSEQIARMLNMKKNDVDDIMSITRDPLSLSTPISKDSMSAKMGDFIEDTSYDSPEESTIKTSLTDEINAVLETLSEKEAQILEYRYGLNNKRPMSLKEIGDIYHLTKERIRQIEKKAISKLQTPSRMKKLEDFIA